MNTQNEPKSPTPHEETGLSDDYELLGALEGPQINKEFIQNVQVMQSMRKEALALSEQVEAETDAAKKAQLQERFNKLEKQINENNQKMIETYKYSLSRNYAQITKTARVFIQLTEEEIKKEKELNADYTAPEDGLAELLTIDGIKANQDFLNNVQVMQSLRDKIVQAREALESETDETKKAEQQAQIDTDTNQLTENNKLMVETYKYSIERNYHYVTEESDLYIQLTPEEIADRKSAQ